ncbi:MAG: hypothetical protein ACHQ2Z_04495 [Elusimicrobiota bacterium]
MQLADPQQAKLLEIFEKGAAKSAEKLSALSGMPWNIHIVSLDVGSGERFRAILARDKRDCLGAVFSNPGEKYMVLFSEESGRALIDASYPARGGKRRILPSMEQSALAEIANVLINGLSGELADRHGMFRCLTAPTMAIGNKAAVFERAFGVFVEDEAMVDVLIHISSPELAADCTVMLRLDALNANFLLNTDPDALSAYLPGGE